ncbi:pirin family protein [Cyanobium sp. FGCU-6]|nr:pirin family protein [Cyanobium sp. FGCU6]
MTSPSSLAPRPATIGVYRPAGERFHSRLDWLDSWHSFSFAGHLDRRWMGFGPLRVINDDTIAPGRGFDLHPHRDMEIVTVMVEGELTHRDSMGNAAVIRAGEVQRMSAGTGVVHGEWNEGARPCRLLQIWIEPSSVGIAPAYDQKEFAIGADWTPLLDPAGATGTMAIHRPVRLWRARPSAGSILPVPLAAGRRGWLQLIEGSVRLQGSQGATPPESPADGVLNRGDGLGIESSAAPQSLQLVAGPAGADLLLFELP